MLVNPSLRHIEPLLPEAAPAGPFSPDDIAGLTLWLDADAITSLTDGQTVSTWQDSSAANIDATASGAPTYQTAELAGKPVVRFDGVDDFFNVGAVSAFSSLTAGTIFIVVKLTAAENSISTRVLWNWNSHGNDNHFPYSDGVIYDGWGSTVRKTTGDPAQSLTDWLIYCVKSSSGNWTNYLDGTQHYTTATNTVGFSPITFDQTQLGRALSAMYMQGDIAEVVMYDTALSDADRGDVEDYLTDKWFAAPTVHERSASITITPTIASAQQNFSVLERSASVTLTPAIASAQQNFSVLSRSAAITLTPAIASARLTVHLRSASVTLTPAIASAQQNFSILSRSVAITLTPAIATAPQRVLIRATAITITPTIVSAGQIEGGLVEHERSASITLTPAVASSATFYSIIERSASVTLTPAIASSQMRVVIRQASVTLTPAIASTGVIQLTYSRSASITIAPTISAAGFSGVIFVTHPTTGGDVAELIRGGVFDESPTGGVIAEHVRGGIVVASSRGGVVEEDSHGATPVEVLGGVFDETAAGGVVVTPTRGGVVAESVRGGVLGGPNGGIVVERQRGGSITQPTRGGVLTEHTRGGVFDETSTGGSIA